MRPAANEHGMKTLEAERFGQMLDRAHHVVDAVLLADLAKINHHKARAFTPRGIGRVELETVEARARPYDVNVLGTLAAARHRDLLVAVVGGDDQVGLAERQAL